MGSLFKDSLSVEQQILMLTMKVSMIATFLVSLTLYVEGSRIENLPQAGTVKELVKCSPDKNAFINKTSDETALMIAAKNGCKNIVENLLQNNANVNAKTTNGKTALMYASENGHKEIVEILLQNHANTNLVTNSVFKIDKLISKLRYWKFYGSALFYAIFNGYEDIVRLLLKNSPDLSIKSGRESDGMPPLMFAAMNCKKEVVKFLLHNNADVNAETSGDVSGVTALMF